MAILTRLVRYRPADRAPRCAQCRHRWAQVIDLRAHGAAARPQRTAVLHRPRLSARTMLDLFGLASL